MFDAAGAEEKKNSPRTRLHRRKPSLRSQDAPALAMDVVGDEDWALPGLDRRRAGHSCPWDTGLQTQDGRSGIEVGKMAGR